ncbi:hypothetical protein [Sulfitobacter sp. S190]|uniref:hypothetical protein n=1 Tax=Sulfitobacter sp. S190 TaxID=2867022 RepID=UPI0021A89662|nr:hypothetical protein [Sulfitobacter sp. S190]UWR23047.1 hypothetical protein K3756_03335 [Sulfitobacter sp. S190]
MFRAVHAFLIRTLVLMSLLAITAVPFGHRAGANTPDPALAAFVALGGDLSDICGDTGSTHGYADCFACRIAQECAEPPARLAHSPVVFDGSARTSSPATPFFLYRNDEVMPPARAPPFA